MSRPHLVVISGPSGAGKTTLVRELLRDPRFRRAVTATTRAPRNGERDGEAYHFRTREDFARQRDRGELLEWAEVHGQWYGTPRSEVEGERERITVLDVDVQGFRSIRASGLPMISVFVAPPSMDVLRGRLMGRGTESGEQLERRLAGAAAEIAAKGEYDHVVVNDDVTRALDELRKILGVAGGRPTKTGSKA